MKEVDLVIIGGGPAGMTAATEAVRMGVSVAVIDENPRLGGKVFGPQATGEEDSFAARSEREIGRRLREEFEALREKIAVYPDTEVWGYSDPRILELNSQNGATRQSQRIKARAIIIAAGALERVIPLPGWTLPGVFSVGGLNTLVKKGVLPGERFMLAGSGPLQLLLAHHLINAGARPVAIVDSTSARKVAAVALQLLTSIDLLRFRTAIEFLKNIKRYNIPVYRSHILCGVHGSREVEKAEIVRIDRSGHPIEGTKKTIRIDTIAYGFGLMPSNELARLCGCEHYYDDHRGYWRVKLNQRLETTTPGIFIAGDGLTIKGYPAAIEEGRVAAIEASVQLGRLDRRRADRLLQPSLRKLMRFRRFGSALDAISAPGPGVFDILTAETVVCRCEEVTLQNVMAAVSNGARDVNDIKRRTRLGMGHCQGRFCGQVINELIWRLTGKRTDRESFTSRIPAKPVPFGVLAG